MSSNERKEEAPPNLHRKKKQALSTSTASLRQTDMVNASHDREQTLHRSPDRCSECASSPKHESRGHRCESYDTARRLCLASAQRNIEEVLLSVLFGPMTDLVMRTELVVQGSQICSHLENQ